MINPMPIATSKRSDKKKIRGIQTTSPDVNKRIHKRSERRNKAINGLRLAHLKRSGAKQFGFNEPGANRYHKV